jgi:hypothetical protein
VLLLLQRALLGRSPFDSALFALLGSAVERRQGTFQVLHCYLVFLVRRFCVEEVQPIQQGFDDFLVGRPVVDGDKFSVSFFFLDEIEDLLSWSLKVI